MVAVELFHPAGAVLVVAVATRVAVPDKQIPLQLHNLAEEEALLALEITRPFLLRLRQVTG